MKSTEAMLCWNPGSDQVALVPWPDVRGASDHYEMTGLACYAALHKKTFEQRKAILSLSKPCTSLCAIDVIRSRYIARFLISTNTAMDVLPTCQWRLQLGHGMANHNRIRCSLP